MLYFSYGWGRRMKGVGQSVSDRDQLIKIFEDTEKWYQENRRLAEAVRSAREGTRIYAADHYPELPAVPDGAVTEIAVTASRTFEAAMRLIKENPGKRVAVHNFASATNPGGGVTRGSRAQEECLCRCSTLYPVLNSKPLWDGFYGFHRQRHDARYTDTCIYSPGILIVKTDVDAPERMPETQWQQVDVITCAAPNLRAKPNNAMNPGRDASIRISDKELLELHKSRARHMLAIAAANAAEVLVLGAFGCGAFQNNPDVVARAYQEVLEEFQGRFAKIEFAVYCSPSDTKNYEAFKRILTS